jgi:hypothetical protein
MGLNAQTIVPTFTASQVLTADQMNQSARTGVPVFATTTTRDAAFGGTGEKTLAEGQMCYIEAAPKRFQVYDGTTWLDYDTDYQAWTPTWTNLTVGNASQDFEYVRLGRFVHLSGRLVFGSTTSITGHARFTLPVNADATMGGNIIASCNLTDAGTANFLGTLYQESATVVSLGAVNASSTYSSLSAISATVPFTWTTNDVIAVSFTYKAA